MLAHLLGASLFWGSSFLFMKLMSGAATPLAIATARGVVGATVLAIVVAARGQRPWPSRAEWRHWAVLGSSNGWIANILVAYGLAHLAVGPAAMIQAAGPLTTAVAAHWLFREERLDGRRFAGVLLGVAGVALLIGPGLMAGGGTALGGLAMLGVTLGYSFGNLYTRIVPAEAGDPIRLALGQQSVSALVSGLLTLVLLGPQAFRPLAGFVPEALALGCLATALPMALFMRLIRAAGPTRAAMTGYLVPLVATASGILVLGETLTLRQIAGGAIILAGVFLVSGARRRKPG